MKNIITLFTILSYTITLSQIDYDTQIQPIFNNNCVSCHSNGAAYTGGIELNNYENLMAGGYTTDNNNVLSVLEDYILTGFMPAWGEEPLNEQEITLITQWIFEGGNPSQTINGCVLSDGTIVENGWSGSGVGDNWCNYCFCENGMLSCSEIWCGEVFQGCMDINACNYDPSAMEDDGSCDYSCYDCCDPCNFDPNPFCGTLIPWCEWNECSGCMDPVACNYDPNAIIPGDCLFIDGICDTCENNLIIDNDIDNDGIC